MIILHALLIEKNNMFLDKISDIEITDKLTEPQIVAKVKKYFDKELERKRGVVSRNMT